MRIAHISDFHARHHLPGTSVLSKRFSRKMPDLIARAVADIRAARPDLLVVTGDLVDYPFYAMHDPEYIALGEKDLRLIREVIEPVGCPVAWVYGNHDHPASFREVFGDAPRDFDVNGHRVLVFLDDEVSGNQAQRMGSERERFLEALRDDDPRPQIHVQHYLVSPERNEGYPHSYRDAANLKASLLADPRTRLVLSGHYHVGVPLFHEAHVGFSTARAFTEPPHPWKLYEIDGDSVSETEHQLDTAFEKRPAVFLDRDGNISEMPSWRSGPEGFRLIPGAPGALARLRDAGYALVVVTNQTAVGMGYVTTETVGQVNDTMARMLAESGVELDGVYCRYHTKNAALPGYRSDEPETKPSPAMLREAAEHLNLDLAASFIVGDRAGDLGAGRNAGCRGRVLVRTGDGRKTEAGLSPGDADHVADDISAAADWILAQP